jgi:hypothetical protein
MGETDGTISPGGAGLNGTGGGAKGVKRTRSLMQRIRAMVSFRRACREECDMRAIRLGSLLT